MVVHVYSEWSSNSKLKINICFVITIEIHLKSFPTAFRQSEHTCTRRLLCWIVTNPSCTVSHHPTWQPWQGFELASFPGSHTTEEIKRVEQQNGSMGTRLDLNLLFNVLLVNTCCTYFFNFSVSMPWWTYSQSTVAIFLVQGILGYGPQLCSPIDLSVTCLLGIDCVMRNALL